MTRQEILILWNVCFDSKVFCEDILELEKAGIPQGFKKGIIKTKLKQAELALSFLDSLEQQL